MKLIFKGYERWIGNFFRRPENGLDRGILRLFVAKNLETSQILPFV